MRGPEAPLQKRATERGVEDPVWAENGPKSLFFGRGCRCCGSWAARVPADARCAGAATADDGGPNAADAGNDGDARARGCAGTGPGAGAGASDVGVAATPGGRQVRPQAAFRAWRMARELPRRIEARQGREACRSSSMSRLSRCAELQLRTSAQAAYRRASTSFSALPRLDAPRQFSRHSPRPESSAYPQWG